MLTASVGPIEFDQGQRIGLGRLDHIYGEVHRPGTLATAPRAPVAGSTSQARGILSTCA
jgi:hypothetical protein